MKVLEKNGQVIEGNFEEKEVKEAFWHTSAHVLAQAVKRLYPDTKCAIGPAIDNGFYYDFDFSFPFTEENLAAIEKEMKKIVKQSLPLEVFEVTKVKALDYMKERQEDYKVEMIEELPEGETITFYKQGDYEEFCAGPEKNKMLTRIYGISFPKAAELKDYLNMLEEAKKRDHRSLEKNLDYLPSWKRSGFPFFLPKGMILKNTLIDYWRKMHTREGYEEISTPILLNRQLWETSGHWDHYRENMYTTVIDDMDFAVKPMNCPGGMLVYKMEPRSYKELPLRLGELGLVHRHEKSGQLHGLMRVRCFTQDDAHIFMTEAQIENEIQKVVKLIDEVYKKFGFTYHVELSTRPDDSMGTEEEWEVATNALENAIKAMNIPYEVNEGDGAFYGPKLDFHLQDSIGRTWQCGTIQLDFQLPQRFEAEYIGADGEKHRPIMIHRVVFGSIERFIGILIEHYAGKFPTWLAPIQAKVLPVSDKFADYAKQVAEVLKASGVRVEVDDRDEKLGYKIRQAQLQKVPYMLILGEKEQNAGTVSVRKRDLIDENDSPELGAMSVEEFAAIIKEESQY